MAEGLKKLNEKRLLELEESKAENESEHEERSDEGLDTINEVVEAQESDGSNFDQSSQTESDSSQESDFYSSVSEAQASNSGLNK